MGFSRAEIFAVHLDTTVSDDVHMVTVFGTLLTSLTKLDAEAIEDRRSILFDNVNSEMKAIIKMNNVIMFIYY